MEMFLHYQLCVCVQFNASDVLKEVTVYEAIDKGARYTQKVRRLAEFCRTKKVNNFVHRQKLIMKRL